MTLMSICWPSMLPNAKSGSDVGKYRRRARPAVTLESIAGRAENRDSAIRTAYEAGVYSIAEIARYFGIHRTTASRIARGGSNARNTT
jgi:DNA invertase Pin-like site-specific DNA recombinase